MRETTDNFFTIGELADMFGISKQTLQYYDRIGLLSPEFISENGYRHYSIHQYLELDVITRLRKLHMSIPHIRAYLEQRNEPSLEQILLDKEQECRAVIAENEQLLRKLQFIQESLKECRHEICGTITLRHYPEHFLSVTDIPETEDGKGRIMFYAEHALGTTSANPPLGRTTGWIVRSGEFLHARQVPVTRAYFSFLPEPKDKEAPPSSVTAAKKRSRRQGAALPESRRAIFPAGLLYLSLNFQGVFFTRYADLAASIRDFLVQHHLQEAGDLYVLPLKNHWLTRNTAAYVTKLLLPVQHIAP